MNKRDFCEAILAAFELSKKEYQLGLSKVFFRPNPGLDATSFEAKTDAQGRFRLPKKRWHGCRW